MSRTKKGFDLFLLSFVQIHGHPGSAVLIEFREIGVDPRHECVVILPGQGLTVQIPQGQLTDRQQGETRFYVSDRPEDFEKLAAVFLEKPLSRGAERIDIEQY